MSKAKKVINNEQSLAKAQGESPQVAPPVRERTLEEKQSNVSDVSSATSTKSATGSSISIRILGLSGEGLQAAEGRSFRIQYVFEKETPQRTDFSLCKSSIVDWNHWMYLPALAKLSAGRVKFTLEVGSEEAIKAVSAFAVDVSALIGRKEVKFPLKFSKGPVNIHLDIGPFKGVAPLPTQKPPTVVALEAENEALKERLKLQDALFFDTMSEVRTEIGSPRSDYGSPMKNRTPSNSKTSTQEYIEPKGVTSNAKTNKAAPRFQEPVQECDDIIEGAEKSVDPRAQRRNRVRKERGGCDDLCTVL